MRNFAEVQNSIEEIFKGGTIRELPITRGLSRISHGKTNIKNLETHKTVLKKIVQSRPVLAFLLSLLCTFKELIVT